MRCKLHARHEQKRADYVLYYKPNIPLAVIEAKENKLSVGVGMQHGIEYVDTLGVPFVFSSNGDAFLMHDRTGLFGQTGRRARSSISAYISSPDRTSDLVKNLLKILISANYLLYTSLETLGHIAQLSYSHAGFGVTKLNALECPNGKTDKGNLT